MQDGQLNQQHSTDMAVAPLEGLLMMAVSVLAVIAAVAIPFFGESLFAVFMYGKSVKKAFDHNS